MEEAARISGHPQRPVCQREPLRLLDPAAKSIVACPSTIEVTTSGRRRRNTPRSRSNTEYSTGTSTTSGAKSRKLPLGSDDPDGRRLPPGGRRQIQNTILCGLVVKRIGLETQRDGCRWPGRTKRGRVPEPAHPETRGAPGARQSSWARTRAVTIAAVKPPPVSFSFPPASLRGARRYWCGLVRTAIFVVLTFALAYGDPRAIPHTIVGNPGDAFLIYSLLVWGALGSSSRATGHERPPEEGARRCRPWRSTSERADACDGASSAIWLGVTRKRQSTRQPVNPTIQPAVLHVRPKTTSSSNTLGRMRNMK